MDRFMSGGVMPVGGFAHAQASLPGMGMPVNQGADMRTAGFFGAAGMGGMMPFGADMMGGMPGGQQMQFLQQLMGLLMMFLSQGMGNGMGSPMGGGMGSPMGGGMGSPMAGVGGFPAAAGGNGAFAGAGVGPNGPYAFAGAGGAGNATAAAGANRDVAAAGAHAPDFNNGPGGPKGTYAARGTGYYPANNRMEGGFKDRKGNKLHTLQDYLAGRAPYVSVAMDSKNGAKYGTRLRIPEMEEKYGRPIEFRVVDTGGAFKGKGMSRIDICTANRKASQDPTINGPLHLQFQ